MLWKVYMLWLLSYPRVNNSGLVCIQVLTICPTLSLYIVHVKGYNLSVTVDAPVHYM